MKNAFLILSMVAAFALGHATAAHTDVVLDLGKGVYNPSLVVYQGTAWAVARSTQLKWDTTGLKWIINHAHLCSINTTDWTTKGCHAFDPWRGQYGVQCRWGSDTWKVPWEAWGVDDTKLFVWPGRGLWAITGRRPERGVSTKYCPQVIWRQWLVQLAPEGQQLNPRTFHYQHDDVIPNVTWASEPRHGGSAQTAPQRALQRAAGSAGQHWAHPSASDQFSTASVSGGHAMQPSTTTAIISSQIQTGRELWLKVNAQNPRDLVHPLARKLSSFMPLSITSLPDSHEHHAHVGHLQRHLQQLLQSGSIGRAAASGAAKQQPSQAGQRRRRRIRRRRRRRQHRRRAAVDTAAVAATATALDTAAARPIASGALSDQGAGEVVALLPATPQHSSHVSSRQGSDAWAAWTGAQPVPLVLSDAAAVYRKGYAINEKNWMPFVYEDQLLVTYSLAPMHRVYQLHPDGSAVFKCETGSGGVFKHLGPTATSSMHGGPPMVWIDPAVPAASTAGRAGDVGTQGYYLGVAHFFETSKDSRGKDSRTYRHFLIKVEAQPPFKILQVSKELPLQYNTHYKHVAFASGLDLAPLPAISAGGGSSTASWGLTTSQATAARRLHAQGPSGSHKPAAPAQAAGTDSTGSIAADAEADEFTWSANPRPAGVNTFSWSAQADMRGISSTGSGSGAAHPPIPDSQAKQQSKESPSAGPQAKDLDVGGAAPDFSWQLAPGPDQEQEFDWAVPVTRSLAKPPPLKLPRDKAAAAGVALLPRDPPEVHGALSTGKHGARTALASLLGGSSQGKEPCVIISYGSGDWESRVAVLTLGDVEQLFEITA